MYYRSYYHSPDNKSCRGFFDAINDFLFRVNAMHVITVGIAVWLFHAEEDQIAGSFKAHELAKFSTIGR